MNTVRKEPKKVRKTMLEEFLILVTLWTELGHIARISSSGKILTVPGGKDEIPTPISVVRNKPTRRRDLADFRN
ncbi:hypothetical protein E2C01_054877 [Portunus trituberculatus]|uniref:Uncharacterized protein n=1 Tax=Portunus trituberculatus TaxID=210409 RepID=A0A5B7GKZ8_PORTR|nr:hypothetical protein [Portunus trituberculatus]